MSKSDSNVWYYILSSIISSIIVTVCILFTIFVVYYIYKKVKPVAVKAKKTVSLGKNIIKIISMFISLIISLEDILADGLEIAADVATVGAGQVIAGPLDFINEIIAEAVQSVLVIACAVFLDDGSLMAKILRVTIVILIAILNVITSFIGAFIPFSGVVEIVINIVSEIIQNILLAYSLFFT